MLPIAIDFILTFPAFYSIINTLAFIITQVFAKGRFKINLIQAVTSTATTKENDSEYLLNELS